MSNSKKQNQEQMYEDLADPNVPAPNTPPLASGNGPSPVIDALLNGSMSWEEMQAESIREQAAREGRPIAGHKSKSIQTQFRYPEQWDKYVREAMEREGTANKSDFFRRILIQDAEIHGKLQELMTA